MELPKEEFNKMIFSRINKLINEYKLIKEGEKIAIALSGGKDSVLTLHALKNYQEKSNFDFELVAISVNEGISAYRQHGIDAAVSNAKICEIPLIQKSFKDTEGFNLDDIHSFFKSACIPCGVFRRNILNKTAYDIGADKIATGHNLDDEIQSFLMSFSRGDTVKFSKFGPELDRIHEKLVPRIKPLWNTPEADVRSWAILNNIQVHHAECPYSKQSLRAKIKGFLNETEVKHPGTKENVMESFKQILDVPPTRTILNECKICGEPTSGEVCKTCEIKEIISNNLK